MDGYLDLTLEEMVAMAAVGEMRLPDALLLAETTPSEDVVDKMAKVGGRNLAARGLVRRAGEGWEAAADVLDAISTICTGTIACTIGHTGAQGSMNWLVIDPDRLAVASLTSEYNYRLRAFPTEDLPAVITRLTALEAGRDRSVDSVGEVLLELDLAVLDSEAQAAGPGTYDDPSALTDLLARADTAGHGDDVLRSVLADSVSRWVLTAYPDAGGSTTVNRTVWLEQGDRLVAIDVDDHRATYTVTDADALVASIRDGFPSTSAQGS